MHKPLNKRRSVGISALIALVCSFLSIFASPAAAQSRCAGDPLVEWTNRTITSGRGLGGVLDAAPFTGELSDTAAAGVYTVRTLSADSGATRASDVAETDESWTAVFLDESDNEVGRTAFTRDLADGVASVESADTFTVRLTGEATSVRVDHKILDANAPANSVSPLCVGLTAASGSTASDSGSTNSGSADSGSSTDAPAKAPCATNPNIPFDSTSCGATSTGSGATGSGSGAAGSGSADTGTTAAPKAPCATNPAIPFDSTSCGAAASDSGAAASGSGAAGSGAAGSGTAGTGTGAAGDAAGSAKPVCLANPSIPFDSTSCDPNAPKAACSTNSAIPFDSSSCADASVLGETVDAPAAGGSNDAAGTDAATGGTGTGDAAAGSDVAGSGAAAAGADGSPTVDGTLAITGAGTVVALTLVFGCLMVAGGIAAMNAASRREIFG